ncbi:MAG: hypothetical protein L0Z53_14370, partial [Acidobacteriales bacterium]|nr:hypothetical protein [Terriglobales bacterium]
MMNTANATTWMEGWKILLPDYSPPIQEGAPLFDGVCPFTTPRIDYDETLAECSFGWNFVRT